MSLINTLKDLITKKTIKRRLYIEVADGPEGREIIERMILFLSESRQSHSYINGWIEPVDSKNEDEPSI